MTVTNLQRLLYPRSVAIVGLSERQPLLSQGVLPMFASGVDVHVVNPRYERVFNRPTVPDLASIDGAVDVVLSLVNADLSATIVEEAAALGAGGIVIIAGGFGETGPGGEKLQRRVVEAARSADLAVCGPNCSGLINFHLGAHLTHTPSPGTSRAGGIAVVSHSGQFVLSAASAGRERNAGFSFLISAGNEAVTDVADYLDALVDDPNTKAIALVLEKIRRPREFLAAADRAIRSGKPISLLKLGRTETARHIAQSHTGALSGDAWPYDVAARQHGIRIAGDVDELVDQLLFFDALPQDRWAAPGGVAIVTASGGASMLASDIAAAEGVELPSLDNHTGWLARHLSAGITANPLDISGPAINHSEVVGELMSRYAADDAVAALLLVYPLSEADASHASLVAKPYATLDWLEKPRFLSALEPCTAATWTVDARRHGIAMGHGLRGTLRGIAAMQAFATFRSRPSPGPETAGLGPLQRPPMATVRVPEGAMLPFDESMRLLRRFAVPTAPYLILDAGAVEPIELDFPPPYVVKLADVAHRTDHGAVHTAVTADELWSVVRDLRILARTRQLPDAVAIQPMVASDGEAFIGVNNDSELGQLVLFGLGGVFVESLRRVAGRFAPLSLPDAEAMMDELADTGVFAGLRGGRPWSRSELAEHLLAFGRLAVTTAEWVVSLDVNPLLLGPDGFVAVDALCLVRHEPVEMASS